MLVKYFISLKLFILIISLVNAYEECTYKYDYDPPLHYCRNSTIVKDCQEKVECREWCAGDAFIKSTVVDTAKGEVKFSIMPSPNNCCHSSFLISLFLYNNEECNDTKLCKEICKHSEIDIIAKKCEKCNSSCNGIIEFNTKYIFNGTYYFVIKPSRGISFKQECVTQPFSITTNYIKQPVGNTEIHMTYNYKGYSDPLLFQLKGDGLSLAEEVIFELSPCNGEELCQVSVTHKNGENKGECCDYSTKTGNCSCSWDEEFLTCTFLKVKPGNYCVTIDFRDPRCSKYTLWGNNVTSCLWTGTYFIAEKFVSQVDAVQVDNTVSERIVFYIIILGSIVSVLTLAIAVYHFCKRYPKKIYHHYVSCAPTHLQQFSFLHKPKILLLYPRDCENFMVVLQDFRSLLQEFLHAQVYDMWDPENWENVNEVGHQWVAKYFLDKNVKIIMIASQCSKMFEYAVVNQRTIEYHQPKYFDNIFLYSFKEAITLANCSVEQYNRFFVVRLDEPNCEENKFSVLTPCTVYTVPQHLKDLTLQIHNMDPGEVILNPEETSKIQQLNSSLAELKKFKLDNPNYLNDMISVVSERH